MYTVQAPLLLTYSDGGNVQPSYNNSSLVVRNSNDNAEVIFGPYKNMLIIF